MKSEEEVKAYLKDKLPRYMIPNVVKKLEELPMTANGKINRNLLNENAIIIFETSEDKQVNLNFDGFEVKKKKIPLALGIVFNCLMLGYFKYLGFFSEIANAISL